MIRKVMNIERPTNTWLGGSVAVPIAWRSSDRTMMIRVKLVIMIRMAGARERTVRRTMSCRAAEKFSRLETSGSLIGCSGPGWVVGAGATLVDGGVAGVAWPCANVPASSTTATRHAMNR